MTTDKLRYKKFAIKCLSYDEMKDVISYLENKIPWTYKLPVTPLCAFNNGFNFIGVNATGGFSNYKGCDLIEIDHKMFAKDFLNEQY